MKKSATAKAIIKHFQKADRYNQLRSGETHLAIEAFIEGFYAALSLADGLKLTSKEFQDLMIELGEYFDQFEDQPTLKRSVA